MKRLLTLLLTVILALPAAFSGIGPAIANGIRAWEAKTEVYPETPTFQKKVVPDDTDASFCPYPENTIETQSWRMTEISFQSDKTYADPFSDVDVDFVLAGCDIKLTIPAFWDGGNTWRVRFACPMEGEWRYRTVCTDAANTTLHGRTGRVICSAYDGDLDVYRHGFVTTGTGKKYMTYDDGTPFFYLGDTHWGLGTETVEMVRTICDTRMAQGFTVWQSEPIGAAFDLVDGVTEADLPGFWDYDEKFQIIADHGFTHANAEFFFSSDMTRLVDYYGGVSEETITAKVGRETITAHPLAKGVLEYLNRLTRYWVARYGAYPVMWTLGQEVDNDFYVEWGEHPLWNRLNNPYLYVAQCIGQYDAYSHPLSAHQENVGATGAYGSGKGISERRKSYRDTEPSAFYGLPEHNWYAVQWAPPLTKQSRADVEKDYWYNGEGKPAINYEGRYCGLWTKNFGSRMQGWASYLSGMYGYGWGGADTWCYLNIYYEDIDSDDGIDIITSEEKINATWETALTYPSAMQMGYMRTFFESMQWWDLTPRFNNPLYFSRSPGVYAYCAGNRDNSEVVVYFYSFSDSAIGAKPNAGKLAGERTGRIGSLEPNTTYKYKWFDPTTGEWSEEETCKSTAFGTYSIGKKQWQGKTVNRDMVFYLYK